jgi:hypothetical protein
LIVPYQISGAGRRPHWASQREHVAARKIRITWFWSYENMLNAAETESARRKRVERAERLERYSIRHYWNGIVNDQ